jgi:hypothetical protein
VEFGCLEIRVLGSIGEYWDGGSGVDRLSSTHEALGSSTSTAKQNNNQTKPKEKLP